MPYVPNSAGYIKVCDLQRKGTHLKTRRDHLHALPGWAGLGLHYEPKLAVVMICWLDLKLGGWFILFEDWSNPMKKKIIINLVRVGLVLNMG